MTEKAEKSSFESIFKSKKKVKNHHIHRRLNGTPFPAQRTADKLLPAENLLHDHTSTHTNHAMTHTDTQDFSALLHQLLWFVPYIYRIPSSLHSIFSPSPGRKPHRMKSMCGAGMIGQWEAGCHWNYAQYTHTHTRSWRGKGGDGKARCVGHWDILFSH